MTNRRPMPAASPRGVTRTLHTERDADGIVTSRVRATTLPSGLRVLTEEMAGARSASVGVWVKVGSRDEAPGLHGCSHFLEHLLFKGTARRSALDISAELDSVGGDFNAFTAKEYTCFHARVLDSDLPLAVDVLGDMVTGSLLLPADVEAEREVILDEIAMHDDDPDDVVHDLFAAQAWGNGPLGRTISGTAGSITALTSEQVRRFYRRRYRPESMVVAAAGSLDHAEVVALVRRAFAQRGFLDGVASPVAARQVGRPRRVTPGQAVALRPLEQVNIVLGVNGLTRSDDRRFALSVVNAALGAGTSSRLFQEVRERRGLAYSVYSFVAHHTDAGLFGVCVGCLPPKAEEVLTVVRGELARVAAEGIGEDELARAKGQLRGGLVLGLEDTGSRMSRLGKAALVYGELLGVDEVLARLDAVSGDQVRELAATLFRQPELLAAVGPSLPT